MKYRVLSVRVAVNMTKLIVVHALKRSCERVGNYNTFYFIKLCNVQVTLDWGPGFPEQKHPGYVLPK